MAAAGIFEYPKHGDEENLIQQEIEDGEETESEDSDDSSSSSSSSSSDEQDEQCIQPLPKYVQYIVAFVLLLATIALLLYFDTCRNFLLLWRSFTLKFMKSWTLTPQIEDTYKLITNKTTDLYVTVEATVTNIFSLGGFLIYYLYESIFGSFTE